MTLDLLLLSMHLMKDKLKSSDIFIPAEHSKQRRTLTTRGTELYSHDFDNSNHILKNISGKTKQEYKSLFRNLAASRECLKLNTDKPADKLKDLCKKLLSIYKKPDYKNTFPELLSIQEIKDNTLKDQLNRKLIKSIKDKSDELYMTIPELINFQEVDSYQFKLKDRKDHPKHETLEIENFYDITKELDINIKELKRKMGTTPIQWRR